MEVSLSTVVSRLVSLAVGVESTSFFFGESLSHAGFAESFLFAGFAASFLGNQNEDVNETELMRMRDNVVSLEEEREQYMRCIAMAMRVT